MVSMATVKFKQKQQRTGNKFVLLRSPITCSDLLVFENVECSNVHLTSYDFSS